MVPSSKSLDSRIRVSLRAASAGVLIGWGILHLFWDAPYRTVLWNQGFLEGIVSGLFNTPWGDYAANPAVDRSIQFGIRVVGGVLTLLAVFSLVVKERARSAAFLFLGSAIVALVSFLHYLDTGSRIGMLIELTAQIVAPALLWLHLRDLGKGGDALRTDQRLFLFIKIAVGLTFFGHGLYAIGFYPVPGPFIDMTIAILRVTEPEARMLLRIAGIFDVLIPVGLCFHRFTPAIFIYAAIWGVLTTLARPVSHLMLEGQASNWSFFLAQTLIRIPHFALPVAGLLLARKFAAKRD